MALYIELTFIYFLICSVFILQNRSLSAMEMNLTSSEKLYSDGKSQVELENELKSEVEKEVNEEMNNINIQVDRANKDIRKGKKKKNKRKGNKHGNFRTSGFMEIIEFTAGGPEDDPFRNLGGPFQTIHIEQIGGPRVSRGHANGHSKNKTKINKTEHHNEDNDMDDEDQMLHDFEEMFGFGDFEDSFGPVIKKKGRNLQNRGKILPAGHAINGN